MQPQAKRRTQRALLGLVLYHHPFYVSTGELELEIGEEARTAISNLVAVKLLQEAKGAVGATMSAVYFNWLESAWLEPS